MAGLQAMAKTIPSAIGIDIGRHGLKAVALSRRGHNNIQVTDYATRQTGEGFKNEEDLTQLLRLLLKDLSGGVRPCGIAVSGLDSFVRVVMQPPTPTHLLREGLRLNGTTVLNQDCINFVLDCDLAQPAGAVKAGDPASAEPKNQQVPYLVAGLPRSHVQQIFQAMTRLRYPAAVLQVAPVALFNAFDFAYEDVSSNEAAVLLDIGHMESTVLVVCRREPVLARAIDFGGKTMMEALAGGGAVDQFTAMALLQQGDPGLISLLADTVASLSREVANSISFFESQREESIRRVFVSGGPTATDALLQVLSDSLELTCEVWDPFARCQISIPKSKQASLPNDIICLSNAFGAGLAALGFR